MAKLSKRQLNVLGSALYNLERARDYIMRPDIAVCHKGTGIPTTTLHYTHAASNATLYEVTKEYGSDLVGLLDGIRQVQRVYDGDIAPDQATDI